MQQATGDYEASAQSGLKFDAVHIAGLQWFYTIGGLLIGIGGCLILCYRIKRIWVLQATSAITLLAVDIK